MEHSVDKFDLSNREYIDGEIKDEWTVHQIKNSFDFAVSNRIISWYCAGLNFQVGHHLFPNISHVHYPNIHNLVKNTAEKYDVNYQEFNTFREAFRSHLAFLRKLGRPVIT